MKSVRYTADALKALRRHSNVAKRIMRVVREYADGNAAHANNVTALVGSTALRLRVGDYRVIFGETATEITVTHIGPRGSVYD